MNRRERSVMRVVGNLCFHIFVQLWHNELTNFATNHLFRIFIRFGGLYDFHKEWFSDGGEVKDASISLVVAYSLRIYLRPNFAQLLDKP